MSNNISFLELPDKLLEIEDRAFTNNFLNAVEVPDSVEKIGDRAFYPLMEGNIKLGEGYDTFYLICDNEFKGIIGKYSKTHYNIPSYITKVYLSDSTLELKSIYIPSEVKNIGFSTSVDADLMFCRGNIIIQTPKDSFVHKYLESNYYSLDFLELIDEPTY